MRAAILAVLGMVALTALAGCQKASDDKPASAREAESAASSGAAAPGGGAKPATGTNDHP